MLRNFVTDTDLKKYFPNFSKYLPTTQSSWATQISAAFDMVMDDFLSKDIDPRVLGIPLDLNRALSVTSVQDRLIPRTDAIAAATTHIVGRSGFFRFAISVSAITGTATIILQGSNDISVDSTTEPTNWATVATLAPSATGESSTVFATPYAWYRISITPGTTITFTAGLYETWIDRLVVWRALRIAFLAMVKERDDHHDVKAKECQMMYDQTMQSVRFWIDRNDDNLIDDADEPKTSGQSRFTL